eukprot:6491737-Amphidinium_carterae.1
MTWFMSGHDAPVRDFQQEFDPRQARLSVDLSSVLHVPGVLHITHNAQRQLNQVLTCYTPWLSDLKALCKLLREPWRQRFITTCVTDERAEQKLRSWRVKPYEARWGTVTLATEACIDLETIIRGSFDVDKFSFRQTVGVVQSEDDNTYERINVGAIAEVIASDFFWAYCKCIHGLNIIIRNLEEYAEGCPCHDPIANFLTVVQDDVTHCEYTKTHKTCPMRGR